MTREIPQEKKHDVVSLVFQGLPYDGIAKRTGVAKGSVAAIVEDVRAGRFPKLGHVASVVSELRELAVALRKSDISIGQAVPLLNLAKRFLGLGVELSLIKAWIQMCQAIPDRDLSRSSILQAAIKLAELEQEGITYDEVPEKVRNATAQLKQLGTKIAALRAEEAKLEGTKGTLTKACQALSQEKSRLQAENKIVAERVQKLADRRSKLEKKVEEHRTVLSRLEGKHKKLEKSISTLDARALGLEKEIAARVEALEGLERVGFSRKDIEALSTGLADIAQRHGDEGISERFLGYVESYDSLLEMEATRDAVGQEVEALTRQKDSLSRLSERVGLTPEEVVEGIAAIKNLRRKGVSPSDVTSYQKVLANADTDPQSFQRMVREFGGVEAVLAARRKELDVLVGEVDVKAQALKSLKVEEARIRESIDALKESGIKQVEGLTASGITEVQKLWDGLRQDITRWGKTRAEMGMWQEELKAARYFTRLPMSEQALTSLVYEVSPLIIHQYLLVVLTWCREKFNPKLRPPRVIVRKYFRIDEYTDVELADVVSWALFMLLEGGNS